MRQTTCLVVNSITVNNFADLFMMAPAKSFQLRWLGFDDLLLSDPPGFNCWTSVASAFQIWFALDYSSSFISVMNIDLYVRCFDSLMSRGPSRGTRMCI